MGVCRIVAPMLHQRATKAPNCNKPNPSSTVKLRKSLDCMANRAFTIFSNSFLKVLLEQKKGLFAIRLYFWVRKEYGLICHPNLYISIDHVLSNLEEALFMKTVLLKKEKHAFLPLN